MRFPSLTASLLFIGFVALVASSAAEAGGAPDAPPPDLATAHSGKIIITEDPPPSVGAELAHFVKSKLKKDGPYTIAEDNKSWTVHLLSFLKKDPAGEQITVVFYDRDNKESIKKLEPVQAFPLSSVKGQKIVAFPDFHLTEDNGFLAGKVYLVRVTSLKGAGEVTLAEGQLLLNGPPAPPASNDDGGK